ncbi:MAG: response regulator [Clostridia bacterium]|nr:response regulator [Clostridia bacterium]
MLIFAIDDEPKSLRMLHKAIAEAAPEADIRDFPLGTAAIEAIMAQGLRPDIVFTDIQMPELDGLKLAVRLKQASPFSKIVFVTGYSEYTLEAFRLHASGYVLKPLEEGRIKEEMAHACPPIEPAQDKLYIQCFGQFEVYWQHKPVMFGRRQTKELLAFLVDREGASCTAEEIAGALWEGETDMRALKHRIRDLISDMKKTLELIGMGNILLRRSGQLAIQRDMVDCDYYRMLDGDMRAANAYHGAYMSQYSWAEITTGRLFFHGRP